jgi:pimeloyl-ACP methyl ester carboxylesterase
MTNETQTQPIGQIISADGTPIAYRRSGEGPALVLVHGATADHTRWQSVLPALEERFTVYAIDRRGRGASGDAPAYAIAREFEDVAAVVDSIGGPVSLLGHSYGALCALEAALRTDNVRRLVLYEPPISTGRALFPRAAVERVEALLAAGDRDGALVAFFRGVVQVPPHELELLRSLPSWEARKAFAHTITRELRAAEEYRFAPARFSHVRTPSLLLFGGDSPSVFTDGTAAVHAALPESRIAVMPGQQHIAMTAAPELFLGTVLPFLVTA